MKVSVCASILLKLRNDKVNLVQSVISLVMKAGHASKQVCLHNDITQLVIIIVHYDCRYLLGSTTSGFV